MYFILLSTGSGISNLPEMHLEFLLCSKWSWHLIPHSFSVDLSCIFVFILFKTLEHCCIKFQVISIHHHCYFLCIMYFTSASHQLHYPRTLQYSATSSFQLFLNLCFFFICISPLLCLITSWLKRPHLTNVTCQAPTRGGTVFSQFVIPLH